jgi:probable HAF family extracellular repeat protein
MMSARGLARAAVLAAVWSLAGGAGAAVYTIQDLGVLPGCDSSTASGINNNGRVVGVSEVPHPPDAYLDDHTPNPFYLDRGGSMMCLGTFSTYYHSYALGVNSAGTVVGSTENTSTARDHACRWVNGVLQDLGALYTWGYSTAEAINDHDQIVGVSSTASLQNRAFLWQNGVMEDLGALAGYTYGSRANAINNFGQVAGFSWSADYTYHAFLWQDGTMQDLGVLGTGRSSFAHGINDLGQVVGGSYCSAGSYLEHAFLWQNGAMQDLGSLDGTGGASEAEAINQLGQVVGWSTILGGDTSHAFLWQHGAMQDLGSLGHWEIWHEGWLEILPPPDPEGPPIEIWHEGYWEIRDYSVAYAINDLGEIVGISTGADGELRAVLWVPEPATLLLLALGGLAAILRRRGR